MPARPDRKGCRAAPCETLPTALYCRLSREDGDREESDSIANQRKLLEGYLADHPELTAAEYYTDDGCTGTNFNRPGFQRMLEDIRSGRICCVLVKDLSRFGRDYIETGRYLERWFPDHGIRFIAVTDNIDSARGAYDMMMPLKNLFNTQYARDISQKVRSPPGQAAAGGVHRCLRQLRVLQGPQKPCSSAHRSPRGSGSSAHILSV